MNLFADLDASPAAERFAELARHPGVRIERIVSLGQASPPGFWYDQPHGEWVAVLEGEARVRFADEPEARTLRRGDVLDIAPHRRHRVEWTDPHRPTVWLAVHYGEALASGGEAPPA